MKNTPKRFLTNFSDETLQATRVFEDSKENLSGVTFDYGQNPDIVNVRTPFNEIKLDPSMVTFANDQGMSVSELLEEMDPSHAYAADDPLGNHTALGRQLIRFGFKTQDDNPREPRMTVPLKYQVAHTPANSVLFPAFMKDTLFWTPLQDVEFDPNLLFASTRTQREDTYKTIRINDSQWRHKRLQRISEMAEVPVSQLTLSGYSGTMIKHGVGLTFSREFANGVDIQLFGKAMERSALRERKAYFDHVLTTIISGDTIYGLTSGATSTQAVSFDSTISAAGQISYFALSLMLHGMRPYKPNLALQNINTFQSYIQAVPPANLIAFDELRVLAASAYPEMPKPTNPTYLGQSPSSLITDTAVIADNAIILMDTKESLGRVVKAGGEVNDTGYDMQHQVFKQISTIYDGIEILPAFRDSCQILSLTVP